MVQRNSRFLRNLSHPGRSFATDVSPEREFEVLTTCAINDFAKEDEEAYEEDGSDDDGTFQQPAFAVDGEPDFDSGPPQDGWEYLRRVRWEAAQCPRVKVAKIAPEKLLAEQTSYMPKIPSIPSCARKFFQEVSDKDPTSVDANVKGRNKGGKEYNPKSLFDAIRERASRFKSFQQQDSHELLRCLLDGRLKGNENKLEVLSQVLEPLIAKKGSVMVFCNTVGSCRAVDHYLQGNNIPTVSYHGEVPAERNQNLNKFRNAEEGNTIPALVCTDLAARGLDLVVDHVIMFDFPRNSIDYLRRTGRTTRMGAKGYQFSREASFDTC